MAWPIFGWAPFVSWNATGATDTAQTPSRSGQLAWFALAAKRWAASELPYWNRTGGADHVLLFAHDEGSCAAPAEVRAATLLVHWGLQDPAHRSSTGYFPDDYSTPTSIVAGDVWGAAASHHLAHLQGWPCYDPRKDIVVPAFKGVSHFARSGLGGLPAPERDILLTLRGDVGAGTRESVYSRGIRQAFARFSRSGVPAAVAEHAANGSAAVLLDVPWASRYRVAIGTAAELPGDYSNLLRRSVFCLVAPGDGWSPRAEDAIPHGCVPLVVMDAVSPPWHPHLDWPAFSVRIAEADVPHAPEILLSLGSTRIRELQAGLAKVRSRFVYTSAPKHTAREVARHRASHPSAASSRRPLRRRLAAEARQPAATAPAAVGAASEVHVRAPSGAWRTAGAHHARVARDADQHSQDHGVDADAPASGRRRALSAADEAWTFDMEMGADIDGRVLDLFADLNRAPRLPEADDGARDATGDAFATLLQVLHGRLRSLQRGAFHVSPRLKVGSRLA